MSQRAKQQRLNCIRKQVLKFGYMLTPVKLTKQELQRFSTSKKYKSTTFFGFVDALSKERKKNKQDILLNNNVDYLTILRLTKDYPVNINKTYGKFLDISKASKATEMRIIKKRRGDLVDKFHVEFDFGHISPSLSL